MSRAAGPLKKTPLADLARRLGARMVDFAGWEMPVQFSSVLDEHHAVRTAAGLFDVSHMGEIEVRGEGSLGLVQRLTSNDASALSPGQAQYSALLTERGTFVDDVLVYRRGAREFLVVVNASNTAKDVAWVRAHAGGDVEVSDASSRWALLALQGPRASAVLRPLTEADLEGLRPYRFVESQVRGAAAIVARTGYTGEDGFEIYCRPEAAADLFEALLRAGQPAGVRPCGLGARDTLRLEAALMLYGNDIDETTTVLEAGLERFLRLEKGEFIGRDALLRERQAGPARRLAGFELRDAGIPRHGFSVKVGGRPFGAVTSGGFGPTVRRSVGLAYLPSREAQAGSTFHVDIRGRDAQAVVVPTPFYRRPATRRPA